DVLARAVITDTVFAHSRRAVPEVAKDAGARGQEGRARRRPRARAGDREEVEATAVPAEVQDDAAPLGGDPLHRAVEKIARVAVAVAEDVAREVLEVRPHQHRLVGTDVPLHE